jgi:hypothetical protein
VEDLDGQVLADRPEHLLLLLLQNLAGAVVWVDDLVPDLVLDRYAVVYGNVLVLLGRRRGWNGGPLLAYVCKYLSTRLIS